MEQENFSYEFDFSQEDVVIDPYTNDLNLIIDKECLLAYPLSGEGFSSMWAGCKATYGVNSGKVAFEAHLADYCECKEMPKDDLEPYLLRVGWSLYESSLQLGEEPFSYALCSNGKICVNKQFKDYGEAFEKGDSIAAYLDFESDTENILVSFSKNGLDMGVAFKVSRKELNEYVQSTYSKTQFVFFPHVLTKNVVFETNFGQRVSLIGDEPFAPIKADFQLIQKLPLELRVHNERKFKSKADCEIIFLIGLPGAGKTKYAQELTKKNPEKFYYTIGVSNIIDKMKMLGLRKKPNTTDSTQAALYNSASKIQPELLDKVLKCLNVLTDIAAQSTRNIILDQANVYASVRRRKLKQFEGFHCKAVVILPTNDEYKNRIAQSEKDENKEIPISLINDMKANFVLPQITDFESIEYLEQGEEDSKKLVEVYNQEGADQRLKLILEKRALKHEERKLNISKAIVMNPPPALRPDLPYKYNRFNYAGQSFYNARRPFNPEQIRGQRYGLGADYANYAAIHQSAYQGYINQAWTHPYQNPSGWNPAMPLGASIPQSSAAGASPIRPIYPDPVHASYSYPAWINPQSNQNAQINQQPQTSYNPWDPVMSTNVSNYISNSVSSSAYSTNINNINSNSKDK